MKETVAPAGRPVALTATCSGVPTAVVEMLDVAGEPAATVAFPGASEMVKSPGGGAGEPGLNRATPAAQFIAAPNEPAKLVAPGAAMFW